MPRRPATHHRPTRRIPVSATGRLPAVVYLLMLLAVLLLPVQMKAGASNAHPHALLQLLIDASDGVLDHHYWDNPPLDHPHEDARRVAGQAPDKPDVPSFGDVTSFGGDLPILSALVALLWLLAPGTERIWPSAATWQGRTPMLEPPPPRPIAA